MVAGILSAVLLVVWAISTFYLSQSGSSNFTAAAAGRIGLVLAALWLAWPQLRRPARWLPPGMAVLVVIGLVVLAANPRLIVAVLPALGVVFVVATLVRTFRG